MLYVCGCHRIHFMDRIDSVDYGTARLGPQEKSSVQLKPVCRTTLGKCPIAMALELCVSHRSGYKLSSQSHNSQQRPNDRTLYACVAYTQYSMARAWRGWQAAASIHLAIQINQHIQCAVPHNRDGSAPCEQRASRASMPHKFNSFIRMCVTTQHLIK